MSSAPPDPPYHLNGDARWKWCETWPRLDHNRFDASRDWEALAQYCEAWADIQQAEREIKNLTQISKMKTGAVVPAQGSIKTSALYEQRAAAMERFDRAAEKLGPPVGAPPSDPWSDYVDVMLELADQDEKEHDPTATRRPRTWTSKRVWAALQRSGGNMAAAARLLTETYGVTCAPATISLLVKKYPQLRKAFEESEEVLLDACYDPIVRRAAAGDPLAQRFLLCMWDP
jgi:phage terminase small subunit